MRSRRMLLSALTMAATCYGQSPAPIQVAGLKISGLFQFREEWLKNPRVTAPEAGLAPNSILGPDAPDAKNQSRTLLAVHMDHEFDSHLNFKSLLVSESLGGRTTFPYVTLWEANVNATMGPVTASVGRFFSDIGMGTVGCAPFMDGGKLALATKYVDASVYLTKFGGPGMPPDDRVGDKATYTFFMGDVKFKPFNGFTLSGSWFLDTTTRDPAPNVIGGTVYTCYSLGAEYKYLDGQRPIFDIKGEYTTNSGAMARKINGTTTPFPITSTTLGSNPKAYFAMAKFFGAHPFVPGSFGFHVQYRHADAGLDPMGFASPFTWNAPFNWTTPAEGGLADNHKGVELSGEVTLYPHLMLKAFVGFMKLVNTTSTLDLGSPALATIASVTPTGGAPIIGTATGVNNRTSQSYGMAQIIYLF